MLKSEHQAAQATITPRPLQIEASACLDRAIWAAEGSPLFVAPVSAGKTLVLVMTACLALERGCKNVIVVSRSRHVAQQSLETLHRYAPSVSGGLYSGSKKQTGQILFATIQTLARHIDVVAGADLLLIDECDQAYLRETTKEYAAVLAACKKYAGVTGTPFVLEKNRTVPIFGRGKAFSEPCGTVTKAALRDLGHFHFIEPAPIAPSRQLKIDRAKIDLSGDYDTKVQASSDVMLATMAADTKAAMDLLVASQQFLFFGSTTDQCDKQVEAYTGAGLRVAAYHNGLSAAAQGEIIEKFRTGGLQGLCTVGKVNRGFDLPSISLVVIGFATASRSKFEQMCGRAQRVFLGKMAAWVLDYGGHGQRFGSANWDFYEAIEFDRRERLRIRAEELAEAIRAGRHDPKCETRPDNFLDLIERTVDLFDVHVRPARSGKGAIIFYVHSLGYTEQYCHADTGWTAKILRFLGSPRFQNYSAPPADAVALIADVEAAELPSHIMLRRVYDTYRDKIKIAPVGFCRDGDEYIFDKNPPVTEEWLRQRAHSRMAYANE